MDFDLAPDWLTPHLTDDMTLADWRDADLLGDITADAFQNDPINLWAFRKIDGMRATFTAMAKHVYGKRGFCHQIDGQAATMWAMSDASLDLPSRMMPVLSYHIIRHGGLGALKRGLDIEKAMERKHPKKPHLYLFTIGVRHGAQGKGLGRRILSPVLKACDTKGVPVYLESSNPDNHGFYSALGFKQMELFHPVPGCPLMEPMWRDPK